MAHALYRNWTALIMPRNIPDSSGSNDLSHFLQRTFMRVACTVVRTDTGPSANFEMNDDFHQGCCCCLPTPMTLARGGSPMFPLVVHQPASPFIWPAVQSLRRGLSTNPGVTMWCVCGCS